MANRTQKPADKPARSRAQVWGTRIARLVLIAALVWLGLTTADGLAELVLEPQPVAREIAIDESSLHLPAPALGIPDPGQWTIADLPFAVQTLTVGADDVSPLLDRVPVVLPGEDAPESGSDDWLTLIRQRLSVLKSDETATIYGLDQPELRVRVSTVRSARRESLSGGTVAFSNGGDEWTVLVLTPLPEPAAVTTVDHLLPLPDGSVTHCARRALDGPVQCELVGVPQPLEELEQLWRKAGWNIQRPALSDTEAVLLYCVRGDEMIQVQSHADPAGGEPLLMLLSVPSL